MKILIIGTGSIGKRHIRNIRLLYPNVQLFFYRQDGRIDDFSIEQKATVFNDLINIDDDIDAAIIANPSNCHKDIMLPLIQRNMPFYVEKPVVSKLDDIEIIIDAIKENCFTATTMVGCNLRFFPCLGKMRSIVHSGTIGNVVRAHFECGKWLPDWRSVENYSESYSAKPSLGGGVVLDLIHEIDAAHWFFDELDVRGSFCGKFSSLDIESEDTASFLLCKKDRNPPAISINLDYVSQNLVRKYEIVGDLGTIIWNFSKKEIFIQKKNKIKHVVMPVNAFDLDMTYIKAMQEFLASAKEKCETSYPLEQGLKISKFALLLKTHGVT